MSRAPPCECEPPGGRPPVMYRIKRASQRFEPYAAYHTSRSDMLSSVWLNRTDHHGSPIQNSPVRVRRLELGDVVVVGGEHGEAHGSARSPLLMRHASERLSRRRAPCRRRALRRLSCPKQTGGHLRPIGRGWRCQMERSRMETDASNGCGLSGKSSFGAFGCTIVKDLQVKTEPSRFRCRIDGVLTSSTLLVLDASCAPLTVSRPSIPCPPDQDIVNTGEPVRSSGPSSPSEPGV